MSDRTKPDLDLIDAIARLTTAAVDAFGGSLGRIVLFGSRVRGDASPASDLDAAILLRDGVEDAWGAEEQVRRLVADVHPRLDIHVLSEADFTREAPVAGTLAYPIAREGVVVYEADPQ